MLHEIPRPYRNFVRADDLSSHNGPSATNTPAHDVRNFVSIRNRNATPTTANNSDFRREPDRARDYFREVGLL